MRSRSSTNQVWKRRLVRGVALFFVFFVFADIAFPQLCGENITRIPISARASAAEAQDRSDEAGRTAAAAAVGSEDTGRDGPTEPTPHDGDCLGGCAHVLASADPVKAAGLLINSPQTVSADAAVRSPLLRGPYHPPRLS